MAPRRRKLFQRIEQQCPNDMELRNHIKRHIITQIDLDDVQDYLNALLQAGPEHAPNTETSYRGITEDGEIIDEIEKKHVIRKATIYLIRETLWISMKT